MRNEYYRYYVIAGAFGILVFYFFLLDCVASSLISVQLVLVSGDGHRIEICISGVIESWALSQYIILSTVEDLV